NSWRFHWISKHLLDLVFFKIVYSFKVRKRLVVLESLDDLYQAMYF
ncbi:unnamed protein product, partial [Brassica rapa subsp. trilocularis]